MKPYCLEYITLHVRKYTVPETRHATGYVAWIRASCMFHERGSTFLKTICTPTVIHPQPRL